MLGFLLGVTLATVLGFTPGLGTLWAGFGIYATSLLLRLPFIRRSYLQEVRDLQDPTLPEASAPGTTATHGHENETGN